MASWIYLTNQKRCFLAISFTPEYKSFASKLSWSGFKIGSNPEISLRNELQK